MHSELLSSQGVTKFAYLTKYAFYPQCKQRYRFDKFTLCFLVHKSIFVSKGCQARQLCQVPEAVWWPVCGVQHELFPGSTRLLSFLVRQAIPKFSKKNIEMVYSLYVSVSCINNLPWAQLIVAFMFVAGLLTVSCSIAGRSLGHTGLGGC